MLSQPLQSQESVQGGGILKSLRAEMEIVGEISMVVKELRTVMADQSTVAWVLARDLRDLCSS